MAMNNYIEPKDICHSYLSSFIYSKRQTYIGILPKYDIIYEVSFDILVLEACKSYHHYCNLLSIEIHFIFLECAIKLMFSSLACFFLWEKNTAL